MIHSQHRKNSERNRKKKDFIQLSRYKRASRVMNLKREIQKDDRFDGESYSCYVFDPESLNMYYTEVELYTDKYTMWDVEIYTPVQKFTEMFNKNIENEIDEIVQNSIEKDKQTFAFNKNIPVESSRDAFGVPHLFEWKTSWNTFDCLGGIDYFEAIERLSRKRFNELTDEILKEKYAISTGVVHMAEWRWCRYAEFVIPELQITKEILIERVKDFKEIFHHGLETTGMDVPRFNALIPWPYGQEPIVFTVEEIKKHYDGYKYIQGYDPNIQVINM